MAFYYKFRPKKCHKTACSTSLPKDEHLVVQNMSKTI